MTGRSTPSTVEIVPAIKGILYRLDSMTVTIWSTAGQMLTVRARKMIVSGSKTSSVRLPKRAATRIVRSKAYLTLRQASGGSWRFPRQRLRENISNVVPSGQSQPHQARPKTRVRMMVRSARLEPTRKDRLASRCESITNGSSRMGKLIRFRASPPRADRRKRARKIIKVRYWTTLRAVIHGPTGLPLNCFLFGLGGTMDAVDKFGSNLKRTIRHKF